MTVWLGFASPSCYVNLMRAYLGYVDHAGLRQFLPEDVLPGDPLRELVPGWTSRSTTVLWAVVADEDAEAILRHAPLPCPPTDQ